MAINFKRVAFSNFMSYGNVGADIKLDDPGTTLIAGENLDDTSQGVGANGVGKSTMINAITYALYNKTISDMTKGELVNNINKKNMSVLIEFSIGEDEYAITRSRKSVGGSSDIKVERNGADITPDDIDHTDQLIQEILGIPYDVFVRSVVFSATLEPFLHLPSTSTSKTNQSDIIEVLFGLTTISHRADAVKSVIKETETLITIEKAEVESIAREKQRHAQSITAAVQHADQWESNRHRTIKNLKEQLEAVKDIDFEEQLSIQEQLAQVDSDVRLLQKESQTITKQCSSTEHTYQKLQKELTSLQSATCPYCNQHFADAASKIDAIIANMQMTASEIDAMCDTLEGVQQLLQTKKQSQTDLASRLKYDNIKDLLEIRSESDTIKQRIEVLAQSDNPHTSVVEQLTNNPPADADKARLDELTNLLTHQKFLHKLLTKKDSFIRKRLLNRSIPYLNLKLKEYLHALGLQHRVEFTHAMTANITIVNNPISFGCLSAGQRARVNLALSLAFRDVLIHLHDHINVCILDEVLDVGLDRIGVQSAARLLSEKATKENLAMFIISHRDEIESAFSKTLKVQMKGGFSQIIQQ